MHGSKNFSARLVKTEKFDDVDVETSVKYFHSRWISLRIGLTKYWIHSVNFVKSCTSWLFQVRQYIYSVNGENVLREDHHTVAQRIMGSNRDYINICVMSHKRELKEKWTNSHDRKICQRIKPHPNNSSQLTPSIILTFNFQKISTVTMVTNNKQI